MDEEIKLGISACLLGRNVRYDGNHKQDHLLIDAMYRYIEFVPICPEVECGFGTPREPFILVGDPRAPRLITTETKKDYTQKMSDWSRQRVMDLEKENLWGFIFKSKSPSCGMQRVKVYADDSKLVETGVGIFARVFMNRFPLIPVSEDRLLNDMKSREGFMELILTPRREAVYGAQLVD